MAHRIKVRPIPNDDVAEVLHHLLNVWEAYGKLEHWCMTTGELACDLLTSYGLAEDTGWGVAPTAAGRALMDREFPDPPTELISE